MTIDQTNSLVKKIHERNSAVDKDINMKIKELQRHLVEISFKDGNHTAHSNAIISKIQDLRNQIFQNEKNE